MPAAPPQDFLLADGESGQITSYHIQDGTIGKTDTTFFTDFGKTLTFGSAANEDAHMEIDIGQGASNPKIRYDTTERLWKFTNDGSNYIAFGGGAGVGDKVGDVMSVVTDSPLTGGGLSGDLTIGLLDDGITAPKLKAINAPTDGQCLTYDLATTEFEWVACGVGGGGDVTSVIAGTGISVANFEGPDPEVFVNQDTDFAWTNSQTYTFTDLEKLSINVSSKEHQAAGLFVTATQVAGDGGGVDNFGTGDSDDFMFGIFTDIQTHSTDGEIDLLIGNYIQATANNDDSFIVGSMVTVADNSTTLPTASILGIGYMLQHLDTTDKFGSGFQVSAGDGTEIDIGFVAQAEGTGNMNTGFKVDIGSGTMDKAFTVDSGGGAVTKALDVSNPNIVTALFFGENDISGTNFSVTGSSGNTDIGGTITAGSGDEPVTTAAGKIDADAIVLITGAGATGTTTSGSGLEAFSDKLGLIQGCSDNEVLTWVEASDIWQCSAPTATTWNNIGAPSGNGNIAMAQTEQTLSWNTDDTTAAQFDGFQIIFTNDAGSDPNIQRVMTIRNEITGATNTTETLLRLQNSENDAVVGTALDVVSGGGDITTAIDVSDANIDTAINIGSNVPTALNVGGADLSPTELSYLDTVSSNIQTQLNDSGDITGVTAGAGLTDGGTSGTVTVNVGAGTGITVTADTVQVSDNGLDFAQFQDTLDLDASTLINLSTYDFTIDLDGTGDFIIASTGTPLHAFDAITGNVGIKTTSPSYDLEVSKSAGGDLSLRSSDTTITTGNNLGTVYFTGTDTDFTIGRAIGAKISARAIGEWRSDVDDDDAGASLEFFVQSNGTANGLSYKAMAIEQDGTVIICEGATCTSPGTLTGGDLWVEHDLEVDGNLDLDGLSSGTGTNLVISGTGVVLEDTADTEEEGQIGGTTVTGDAIADQLLVGTGANALAYKSIPDCATGGTDKLLYSTSSNDFTCGTDQDSGATAFDAIGDPSGNGAVAMGETVQTLDWNTAATAATFDGLSLTITNDASTDSNTQRALVIENSDDGGADGITERLLVIDNADANEAVTTALEITTSSTGTIGTAIDVSDSGITTALDAGTGTIVASTWDASGATAMTIGSADVTQLTITTNGTGNTEVILPAGSISGTEILDDTVALTTDTDGNYVASITNGTGITGGDAGSEGAALTLAVDQNAAFTWTDNHTWNLSSGENLAITHDMTSSIDVISMIATPASFNGTTRGLVLQQADSANAFGLDTALLIDNADTNLPLTTGIQFTNSGGSSFTKFLDTPSLDISGAGAITGATGVTTTTLSAHTASGTYDMNTNIITNIGNTGTDFVASTGGLNLAGPLVASDVITLSATSAEGLDGGGLVDCDNATDSKLLYDAATNQFSCGTDQTAGTTAYDDIGNPDANTTIGFGSYTNTWTASQTTGDINVFTIDFDQVNDGDGLDDVDLWRLEVVSESNQAGDTLDGLVIQYENGTANTVMDSAIKIDNAETTASTMTDAIIVTSSGVDGGVVDAIDVSDSNITNAINIGVNPIVTNSGSVTAVQVYRLAGGLVDDDDSPTWTGTHTFKKADPSLIFDVTTATDTDFWLGVQDDASNDDNDTFQIGDGTTAGTNPFLTIDTSGNVGIGDTTPDTALDITSSASSDGIYIDNTAVDGDPTLAFQLGGTNKFTMGVDDGDIDQFKLGTIALDGDGIGILKITSLQDVGIGTFGAPTKRLVIEDKSASDNVLDTLAIRRLNSSAVGGAGLGSGVIFEIENASSAVAERASIDVALTTATGSSEVADMIFSVATGGTVSEVMRLDGDSLNVGIGTTIPSVKLEVEADQATVAAFNRTTDDGTIIALQQAGTQEGEISVTGATVSYNAFTGSHYVHPEEPVERGMLVSLTGNNLSYHDNPESEPIYGVRPSSQANDPAIIGSYLAILESTKPESLDNPHLAMAVGNGFMWLVDRGEDLEPGDALISSNVSGHAMLDDVSFPVSHVIATITEIVRWDDVDETVVDENGNSHKHKLVSVVYTPYAKTNETQALTNQLAMKDRATGEDYCVFMENGELVSEVGGCGE